MEAKMKVITTQTHGDLCTSPMNAGSLEPGDMIVIEDRVETVESVILKGRWRIHNQTTIIQTNHTAHVKGRNTPLDRVVGARSAGQVN
jgi:hypothetical protein